MLSPRGRASSVSSALSNLHKHHTLRRTNSNFTGLTSRTLRVVLLGVGGVGKTAMCVRFLTKRFIGDYDPNLEMIYRHTAAVDNQLVNFEIMDTAGQEDNCLLLEDKCKWGESFIFVYDVTDRYSFDELSRLKFIASYVHAKIRVNFKPCWILVGNKADLAENDRMVTSEEGLALARDLGCHMFREISIKESMEDAREVFEDLWRGFSCLSPRSPSTSQRRKFFGKIQDKIPILTSEGCSSASEPMKTISNRHNHNRINEVLVTTLTSTLKRQSSAPLFSYPNSRPLKYSLLNQTDDSFELTRNIPSIPENIKEEPEEHHDSDLAPLSPINRLGTLKRRVHKSDSSETRSPSHKTNSSENAFASLSDPVSNSERFSINSVSSTSSSNTSLNSLSEVHSNEMKDIFGRHRTNSDVTLVRRKNSEESRHLQALYQQHCLKHRGRRYAATNETEQCSREFSRLLNTNSMSTPCNVRSF